MSFVSLTPPARLNPLKLFAILGRARAVRAPEQDLEEETRARRDFILEKMEENPSIFQSEYDVQCLMDFYPSRF